MGKLSSPKELKRIIEQYGFRFNKNLGQNFLIDENILQKIVDAAELDKNTGVIEIGPGIGVLTQVLAENAGKVIAIELDSKLIPILNDTLADYSNISIINKDVLKVNISEMIQHEFNNMQVKVVANLPYYITTPIIMELLERKLDIDSIVVMIQKEVAQRMVAAPGSKDFGALSLVVQYYTNSYIIGTVSPHCFIPQPKVDSMIIRLDLRPEPPVEVDNEKIFFKTIKAAFGQRRKTLLNALFNSGFFQMTKDELKEILRELEIQENQRGEELSMEQFAKLANKIEKIKTV